MKSVHSRSKNRKELHKLYNYNSANIIFPMFTQACKKNKKENVLKCS